MDSLVAVELRSWFLQELDADMPVLKILGGSSVLDLLEDAMTNMSPTLTPALTSDTDSPPAARAISQPFINSSQPIATPSSGSDNGISTPMQDSDDSGITTPDDVSEPETKEDEVSKILKHQEMIIAEAGPEQIEQMSFGQSRFWFLQYLLRDPTTFNMAISVRLEGRLLADQLERSLEAVASKHEALRTRWFVSGDRSEQLMQGVLSRSLIHLSKTQISDESDVSSALDSMREHEWDLSSWESLKCNLLTLSDNVHYLIIGAHHIAMDGISFQIFFADLEAAYRGQQLQALPEESQYRSFAARQRHSFASGNMEKAVHFYRGLIPTDPQPIPLLLFAKPRSRPILTTYHSNETRMRLDSTLTSAIRQQARSNKSTTFHFYLATLRVLLFGLLPTTTDLSIGIADANRTDKALLNTMGFLLNLLPLWFTRSEGQSFGDIMRDTKDKAYGALQNSEVPFDVLLDQLSVDRSASHTPIFQVFMDYRQGVQERQRFADLRATGEDWRIAKTGYDIQLDVIENSGSDALLTLKMQASLYEQESVELMLRSYHRLLEIFTRGADKPALEYTPWPAEDIERAIELGKGDYPRCNLYSQLPHID